MPFRLLLSCLLSTILASLMPAQDLPVGHPQPAAPPPASGNRTGEVLQIIEAGRYIYLDIQTAQGRIWVATAATAVEVGEQVTVSRSMPMKDFYSQTLKQSFDMVYFADGVTVQGQEEAGSAVPAGHPTIGAGSPRNADDFDLEGIEKAPDGYTVAEVYASGDSLVGREIAVRGMAVKFNVQILDQNWIHLRDGTGSSGSNDLVVTTQAEVKPGDLVTVKGQLARDRDFGNGYRYDLIIQNASVTREDLQFPPSRLSTASGEPLNPDAYYEAEECGACHEQQLTDWQGSAHSQAHTDGIYLAFAERAREEGGEALYVFCSACHAPLAVGAGEIPGETGKPETFLTREGVSCEACHAAKGIQRVHRGAGANASLVLDDGETRYGPMVTPAENDAHTSTFSELHTRSDFCSACHTLVHPFNGVAIENSYEEWKHGPYAKAGVQCQDCHMRSVEDAQKVAQRMRPIKVPGQAAVDGPQRPNVYSHLFVGGSVNAEASGIGPRHVEAAHARLKGAATIALRLPEKTKAGKEIGIEVDVTNVAAGHAIPSSITELRQVWIDITVTDRDGNALYRSGAIEKNGRVDPEAVMYHSVLHDKNDELTYLPWRATKIAWERLIMPKETVTERYAVTVPKTAKLPLSVRATLRYRAAPQDIMDELFGQGRFKLETVDMATTTKRTRFSRRLPDHVTDELCVVLAEDKVFGFNDLFERVFENLKLRNAVSGGEEMLRLRAYEKLQNLVTRGLVEKNGKEYRGLENIGDASSANAAKAS